MKAALESDKKTPASGDQKVGFEDVTVYEFPVAIGDNPACREGCPVRLGDTCIWESKLDVEMYEDERCPRGRGKELYLDVQDRAAMLLEKGYTLDEIVCTVMEVEEVKKSRSESLKLNNREKLVMAMDNAGKTIRKLVGNKRDEPVSVQARMA